MYFKQSLFVQVVSEKGKKVHRTTATNGREAYTVMAAVAANGDCAPPLVLFKG